MSRLEIPLSDHSKIRRSVEVQSELRSIASRLAGRASSAADAPDGYGTDLTVEADRARAHVWPETGKAMHAEIKDAPLMGLAAEGQ